jgi:hypothetical protein
MCLGGPKLDTLYVTTFTLRGPRTSPPSRTRARVALRPGVQGIAETEFGAQL